MSTEAVDQYFPGLEGVIASESAICNLEGKQGQGGLEYRGYSIEDLAESASYEETAYLLLHGDLPTQSQLADFDARLEGRQGDPRAAGGPLPPDPADRPPDGRPPDLGERPGPFRPGPRRQARRTTPPMSAKPSG